MKTTTTCTQCGSAIPASPLNHPDYGPALCVRCRYATRQEKIVHGILSEFDVAAATVAAPEPQEAADDKHLAAVQQLADWLDWMDHGNEAAFRMKFNFVRHIAGRTGTRTDAEWAKKFNTSRARASQLRREFIEKFPAFAKCNSRQRLTSPLP